MDLKRYMQYYNSFGMMTFLPKSEKLKNDPEQLTISLKTYCTARNNNDKFMALAKNGFADELFCSRL